MGKGKVTLKAKKRLRAELDRLIATAEADLSPRSMKEIKQVSKALTKDIEGTVH